MCVSINVPAAGLLVASLWWGGGGLDAQPSRTNLFAVLGVGEVDEVIVVHLLCVDDVTVLLLTQVLGVDAVGSQKLLVSYAESLTDGLSNELRLQARNRGIKRGACRGLHKQGTVVKHKHTDFCCETLLSCSSTEQP